MLSQRHLAQLERITGSVEALQNDLPDRELAVKDRLQAAKNELLRALRQAQGQ